MTLEQKENNIAEGLYSSTNPCVAIMSVTIAALPPTVNDLLPDQRTRLLRSTRKLGHVLGATPHVLDNAPLPAGPSKRRNSKLFSHSSSSSQTSLAAVTCTYSDEHLPIATTSLETRSNSPVPANGHKRMQSKELPRLLVLRLQSVAPPTAETLKKTLTTSSTTSLNVSVPPSLPPRPASTSMLPPSPLPHQDSFSVNDVDKSRRKRMAKLARTLGENIPTELVFPGHHKSPSEPPPSALARETHRSNSSDNARRPLPQPPLQNISGYETMSAPQRPEPLVISRANVQRSRSLTVGAQTATARRAPRKLSPQRIPEEPPFASIRNPVPDVDQTPQRSWDGEWSIQDSEKRAMALRNLKSR